MDDSDCVFENVTLSQFINLFNISVVNITNNSDVNVHVFDLYEAYRSTEKDQLLLYKWIAYILGSLIMISNLTVVISSGLILRKGQQHKSTYLLLGNVSLADTMIGFSIIFGASIDHPLSTNQLCIFQLSMLVCPAIVSIFSVGFIAIDRYIYILHGLYYQRWFNTTRVRIGIICIWMIGVSLAFTPITGWVNHELIGSSRCQYVGVFPGSLVLLISLLSTIPVFIVAIAYTLILMHALRNLKNIKLTQKSVQSNTAHLKSSDEPKLRINRAKKLNTKTAHNTQSVKCPMKHGAQLKRSASFCTNYRTLQQCGLSTKSKSNDDLNISTLILSQDYVNRIQNKRGGRDSNLSVYTIESSVNELSLTDTSLSEISNKTHKCNVKARIKKNFKIKGPNKFRAVAIVTLTSLSFIITWMPYFAMAISFVLCKEKCTNPTCLRLLILLSGPIPAVAFLNSILNPLIYAWWHKGFKKSIKNLFRKYFQSFFFKR